MYNGMSYGAYIFQSAWNLMCTEFTINGFTISYGKVFGFSLLTIFVVRAVFVYFLLRG